MKNSENGLREMNSKFFRGAYELEPVEEIIG